MRRARSKFSLFFPLLTWLLCSQIISASPKNEQKSDKSTFGPSSETGLNVSLLSDNLHALTSYLKSSQADRDLHQRLVKLARRELANLAVELSKQEDRLLRVIDYYSLLHDTDTTAMINTMWTEHVKVIKEIISLSENGYLDQVEQLKRRVGRIDTPFGSCSGFLVSQQVVRTASHCLDLGDRRRFEIEQFESFKQRAARSADDDLYILTRLGLLERTEEQEYLDLAASFVTALHDKSKNSFSIIPDYFASRQFTYQPYAGAKAVNIKGISNQHRHPETIDFVLEEPLNRGYVTIASPLPDLPLGIVHFQKSHEDFVFKYDCGEFEISNAEGVIRHRCPTEKGSSGALLVQDEQVVAMHLGSAATSKIAVIANSRFLAANVLKDLTPEKLCRADCPPQDSKSRDFRNRGLSRPAEKGQNALQSVSFSLAVSDAALTKEQSPGDDLASRIKNQKEALIDLEQKIAIMMERTSEAMQIFKDRLQVMSENAIKELDEIESRSNDDLPNSVTGIIEKSKDTIRIICANIIDGIANHNLDAYGPSNLSIRIKKPLTELENELKREIKSRYLLNKGGDASLPTGAPRAREMGEIKPSQTDNRAASTIYGVNDSITAYTFSKP